MSVDMTYVDHDMENISQMSKKTDSSRAKAVHTNWLHSHQHKLEKQSETVWRMVHDLDSLNDDSKLSVYHGIPNTSAPLMPSQLALIRMRKHHQQEAIIRFRRERMMKQCISRWKCCIDSRYRVMHDQDRAQKHTLRRALSIFLSRAIQTCHSHHLERTHDVRYSQELCWKVIRRLYERAIFRRRKYMVCEYYTEEMIAWQRWKGAFSSYQDRRWTNMATEVKGYDYCAGKRCRYALNILRLNVAKHFQDNRALDEIQQVLRSKKTAAMRKFLGMLSTHRFYRGVCIAQAEYFMKMYQVRTAIKMLQAAVKARHISRSKDLISLRMYATLCLRRWQHTAQLHMNRYYRQSLKYFYRSALRRLFSRWMRVLFSLRNQKRIRTLAWMNLRRKRLSMHISSDGFGKQFGMGKHIYRWRKSLRIVKRSRRLLRTARLYQCHRVLCSAFRKLLWNASTRLMYRKSYLEADVIAWNHYVVRLVLPIFKRWSARTRRRYHDEARRVTLINKKAMTSGICHFRDYQYRMKVYVELYKRGRQQFKITSSRRAFSIWKAFASLRGYWQYGHMIQRYHFRKFAKILLRKLEVRVGLKRQHILAVHCQEKSSRGRLARSQKYVLEYRAPDSYDGPFCALNDLYKSDIHFKRMRGKNMLLMWKSYVENSVAQRDYFHQLDGWCRIKCRRRVVAMLRYTATRQVFSLQRIALTHAHSLWKMNSQNRCFDALKKFNQYRIAAKVHESSIFSKIRFLLIMQTWKKFNCWFECMTILRHREIYAAMHCLNRTRRIALHSWQGWVQAKREFEQLCRITESAFKKKLKCLKFNLWLCQFYGIKGVELLRRRSGIPVRTRKQKHEVVNRIYSMKTLSRMKSDKHFARQRLLQGMVFLKKLANWELYVARAGVLAEKMSSCSAYSTYTTQRILSSLSPPRRVDKTFVTLTSYHCNARKVQHGWTQWRNWYLRRKELQTSFLRSRDLHYAHVKFKVFEVFRHIYRTNEELSTYGHRYHEILRVKTALSSFDYWRECRAQDRSTLEYCMTHYETRLLKLCLTSRLVLNAERFIRERYLIQHAMIHKNTRDVVMYLRLWRNEILFRALTKEYNIKAYVYHLKQLWFPRLKQFVLRQHRLLRKLHWCDLNHTRMMQRRVFVTLRTIILNRARDKKMNLYSNGFYKRTCLWTLLRALGKITSGERCLRRADSHNFVYRCRTALKKWKARIKHLLRDHFRGSRMYKRNLHMPVYGSQWADVGRPSLSPLSQHILLLNSHARHLVMILSRYMHRWTLRYRVLQSGVLGAEEYKRRVQKKAFGVFKRRIYSCLAMSRTGEVLYGAWKRIMHRRGLRFFQYHTFMCKAYKKLVLLRLRRYFTYMRTIFYNASLGRKFIHLIFTNLQLRVHKELAHIFREWKIHTQVERTLEEYLVEKDVVKRWIALKHVRALSAWKVQNRIYQTEKLATFLYQQHDFFKKRGIQRLKAFVMSVEVERKRQVRAAKFRFQTMCIAFSRRSCMMAKSVAADQKAVIYFHKSLLRLGMSYLCYNIQKRRLNQRHIYAQERRHTKYKLRVATNSLLNYAVNSRSKRHNNKKMMQFYFKKKVNLAFHVLDSRVCMKWARSQRNRLVDMQSKKCAMLRAIKSLQHHALRSKRARRRVLDRVFLVTSTLGIPIS